MKGISGDLFAYTSTRHAFTMIVQIEGVKGLYKGMWPNLLKVQHDQCCTFIGSSLCYEVKWCYVPPAGRSSCWDPVCNL